MARTKSTRGKRLATNAKRTTAQGPFVLGRKAFAQISAVEGVHLSKELAADLKRLKNVSSSERRQQLAAKYGQPKL